MTILNAIKTPFHKELSQGGEKIEQARLLCLLRFDISVQCKYFKEKTAILLWHNGKGVPNQPKFFVFWPRLSIYLTWSM